MEEIKTNEYIRFKGEIRKIVKITQVENRRIIYLDNGLAYNSDDLKEAKHSEDITDLIREGDIVVYTINTIMTDINIVKEYIDTRTRKKSLRVGLYSIEKIHIKQVATKEQFNSIKYVLEE